MGGNREIAERFIASLEARDWEAWAALLHPDVVYEIPQSRERIRGRDRYLRFNQEYPGDWHLRPKVVIADEQHGVVWFEWRPRRPYRRRHGVLRVRRRADHPGHGLLARALRTAIRA